MPNSSASNKLLALVLSTLSLFTLPALLQGENDFIERVAPLPIARDFHGAAVLGDFLYVIGGSAGVEGKEVPAVTPHVAKIFPGGQLSKFLTTSRLAQPRHYISNTTLVLNDTVYVIGGSEGTLDGNCSSTIAWSRPLPNGMLGPWKESAPFPHAGGLSCSVSVSTPGYLHILGGADQEDIIHKEVWSVKINPDGSLGNWEAGPSLPSPRWFHSGAVAGGRVYIWGGLDYYSIENIPYACADIFSAPILSSGRLGKWRTEQSKLPEGFYAASTATAGPYVFCISPRYKGRTPSNDLWWTFVTPNGISQWKRIQTELPNKLYRASTTDYRRGIIYVSGGKSVRGAQPIADQFIIRLSPQAKSLAEKSWIATQSSTQFASIDFSSTQKSQLSFLNDPSKASGSIPGFYHLDAGRSYSQKNHLPLVMYFNAENTKPCKEQLEVIQTEGFSSLLNQAVFTTIDPQKYPQFAQQYTVFRVPTWIFFDSNEEERGRLIGAQDFTSLNKATQALQ